MSGVCISLVLLLKPFALLIHTFTPLQQPPTQDKSKCLGCIPFNRIISVVYLPQKKSGCQFSVWTIARKYCFRVESNDHAQQW